MASSQRERAAETKLREGVKEFGAFAIKMIPVLAGIPDRLVVFPEGRVVWVELKRQSGGRLSEIQKVRHARLRKMGHEVVVLAGTEEVAEWLNSMTTSAEE